MNMIEGAFRIANSKSTRTNFSESPLHLLAKLEHKNYGFLITQ